MFENASNCELNVSRYLLALMNVHLQPERAVEPQRREDVALR